MSNVLGLHRCLQLILSVVLLMASSANELSAQTSDYAALRAEAERQFAEGSYARAQETYEKAAALDLSAAQRRWVEFRLTDTSWRAANGTNNSDTSVFDKAQERLIKFESDATREEDRDEIWAEALESRGDFNWLRIGQNNWYGAWPHYEKALDWWAGSPEIERARGRYISLIRKMTRPPIEQPYYYYGYYGNYLPLPVIENYVKIARTPEEQAHANYLLGMTLRQQYGWDDRGSRIPGAFEKAIKIGKESEWHDDAIFNYAEALYSPGRMSYDENGTRQFTPDFVKAVELYKKLTSEYAKAETQYYENAEQRLKEILGPSVAVSVAEQFLPGSELSFYLNWRNAKRIDLRIYRVDWGTDLASTINRKNPYGANWLTELNLDAREKVAEWSRETGDTGLHIPGSEEIKIEKEIGAGVFIVEALTEGQRSREMLVVSDAAMVLKQAPDKALVYFCEAMSGAPIAGAEVKGIVAFEANNDWQTKEIALTTDDDGIAHITYPEANSNQAFLFISAAKGDHHATFASNWYRNRREDEQWRAYAFTDRPAYRPEETVKWKFIVRNIEAGHRVISAERKLTYTITDPQGNKIAEDTVTLNAFGSAWGELPIKKEMPLGEYQVAFIGNVESGGNPFHFGNVSLFRVEEYKLPEFKVAIKTPEVNGKKKIFRLGESVEAEIGADYYFGGAVANADVQVIVRQNPFYYFWTKPREYPWLYEDMNIRPSNYGGGSVIKQETVKTDAQGKVKVTFETPQGSGQDFEYQIEARVTDSSRREIVGQASVRVTRQSFYVNAEPAHYLYRPQDKVKIEFAARDANGEPVQTEGRVRVTRNQWKEIWLDPLGRDVTGTALDELRSKGPFPPPVESGRPWRLRFRGYDEEEILVQTLRTAKDGKAALEFTPEREGYYIASWVSRPEMEAPIRAQTSVWVATNNATELGYRHGAVQIIVDNDTFKSGEKAPIMVTTPSSGQFVLFGVEGEDLYETRLLRMDGTAKFLEVDLDDRHVPNVFLTALSIFDGQMQMDNKQVIVPPVKEFLTVELTPDKAAYEPREEGSLRLLARDHAGKPIAAEIALALTDESVSYIQSDYAGDPRQFFFGQKRQQWVQTQSTLQFRSIRRRADTPNDQEIAEMRANADDFNEYDAISKSKSDGGRAMAVGQVAREEGASHKLAAASEMIVGDSDASNMPASAPAPLVAGKDMYFADSKEAGAMGGGEKKQGPEIIVRSDFRSTAFWQPDVVTDAEGKASVKFKYPESLTTWKAVARAAGGGGEFGFVETSTQTRQPLIVRLQAPRFFVVGDLTTVSAVINNNTNKKMTVTPKLAIKSESESLKITGLMVGGRPVKGEAGPIEVPANGEARMDWAVSSQREGAVELEVSAVSDTHADAMKRDCTVYEHGIEKFIGKSGKMRDGEAVIALTIPAERKPESTKLEVTISPSLAVTMLDALPYLIDYPYGCTEQTMSRFLPATIVSKTLKDLGLQPADIAGKMFGGIEEASAAKTHKKGPKDLAQLDEMTAQGLERLYDFQHDDGGWGWWKNQDSDRYMSAYVVWGLALAHQAGIEIKSGVLDRGANYLANTLVEDEFNQDMQAWSLHAIAEYKFAFEMKLNAPETKAFDNLYKNRDKLNAYTRALLAISAHRIGKSEEASVLIENLRNGVIRDDRPDDSVLIKSNTPADASLMATAHWGNDGIYWRWSEGGIEATATALRALMIIDPKSDLVEPVMNWLIKNRRGAQWNSTRDTAIVVLAMNDYLRASGELANNAEYELTVNGAKIASNKIEPKDILAAPSRFAVPIANLRNGANEIRIARKSGEGALYFSAKAQYFSLEEPITPAGNEIFARRDYKRVTSTPTLLKGFVQKTSLMDDNATVTSGDRVEVRVLIEAKNNYEYLMFEDLKPAGLEAVELKSGGDVYVRRLKASSIEQALAPADPTITLGEAQDYTGDQRRVYQELRDRKIALFIDHLPEGIWEIRYEMRAETPGKFHALPLMGQAMYVPEIRCNSTELRINVEDTAKK